VLEKFSTQEISVSPLEEIAIISIKERPHLQLPEIYVEHVINSGKSFLRFDSDRLTVPSEWPLESPISLIDPDVVSIPVDIHENTDDAPIESME